MIQRCLFILLLFMGFAGKINAQFNPAKTEYNFGSLDAQSERTIDFPIFNSGTDVLMMLRADVPEDCLIKYSKKEIAPGDSGHVRIKINPKSTGGFSRKILIYASNAAEPMKFSIKGKVKELADDGDLECPDFNSKPEEKKVNTTFTVEVLDKESRKAIPGAVVRINPTLTTFNKHITGGQGTTTLTVPIGMYEFDVKAKNYTGAFQLQYVGRSDKKMTVFLEAIPQPLKDTTTKPAVVTREEIKPVVKPESKPAPAIASTLPDKPAFVDKPGELSHADFAPNNIVFLIDVSSSMASPTKLPLLKESMKTLVANLRDVDRISIVTYADGTKVVLGSTTADNKKEIGKIIDKLEAHGATQGRKGIQEAYRVARENFITDGNNQIILATDGDFKLGKTDEELYSMVKENTTQGIKLSVLGFGKRADVLDKMHRIAENGNGSYIRITSSEEAKELLVEEVKVMSKRD